MDHLQIKERIKEIVLIFGMKHSALSKAMNVTVGVVKQKMNNSESRNKFNQKNLDDLINYLKTEVDKL